MQLRFRIAFLTALAALLTGALAATAAPANSATGKAGRLVAFRSCPDLLGFAKSQATRFVGPYGFGNPVAISSRVAVPSAAAAADGRAAAPSAPKAEAAPQQGVDYSVTNVQEEGVDEPDSVKTDGKTLFAVSNGNLNAVDVTGAQPKLLDTLKLDGGWSHELLLHGDRVLVLSRGGYWAEPLPAMAARIMPPQTSNSVLTEVDVSNPNSLRVVRTLTLDGAYVTARLVGSTVRIVASAQVPQTLPYQQPMGAGSAALAAARDHNKAVVASSGVKSWLPYYTIKRAGRAAAKPHAVVQCRDVSRPIGFAGLGMLTVLTVDLAKGLEPIDSVAVMTDARIVYASANSLYVTTERWADRPVPAAPMSVPANPGTEIHKFDISDPTKTVYRGSGSVSGYLLSQWSLSEFQGILRVVSTETPAWFGPGPAGESESFLTTLKQADSGQGLTQVGRAGNLGKGQRVYAVRFAGNTGYVVTFKQVDPLYTMDLSDPAKPAVVGELEIPGYSAYLHPIADNLLLGIGQDVDDQGHLLGTQVSLFDVSDLRHPTRIQQASLGAGWSEAESDHHAFLYWPKTATLVVPFNQRAVGFRISKSAISQLGQIEHQTGDLSYAPAIRRSLVVRDAVLTVSDAGVKASALSTFGDLGWAAFPFVQSPPIGIGIAKPGVVNGAAPGAAPAGR